MGEVIGIRDNQPHKMSIVVCLKCHKRWLALREKTVLLTDLVCSNCGPGYVIETGEDLHYTGSTKKD